MSAVRAAADALDPSKSTEKTMALENTQKRDTLITIEKRYQAQWAKDKIFEVDAPSIKDYPLESISPDDLRAKQPKFFSTWPYGYMNGTLHSGHAFTASKIEFGTGFQRMSGRKALYPYAYHCTGMPIKACADKLVREVELFGKNFERYKEEDLSENGDSTGETPVPAPTQAQTREDVTKFIAKKSKAVAKTVQTKYQFQIMLTLGIPVEDIHKFADPYYWIDFFPPLAQRDLTAFGSRIDWRRSFVTTDYNPYYDSFVRWQVRRLKELGKIKFGKRYTIYSPKDGQPCLDHDRAGGEGVLVQEYTALKLKVKEWAPEAQKLIAGKVPENANVYFIPATLRPETMYGQTCCFVGPKITYAIFKLSESEYYFISDRAARNMSFQVTPEWGVFDKVVELPGSAVVGTLVNAPLSVHKDGVRILPMETVKANKGTGVVSCVPSDSPDDYATTLELQKKPEYYGIKPEWIALDILPIIETPTYGNLTAPTLVKQMKINGPKDTKLAEAKDLAYKEGFYQGKMIFGEFAGKSVQEAKTLAKQSLVDSGDAFTYAEPDGLVTSRSGDDCVAANLDQWYLNYGADTEWRDQVIGWVGNERQFNTFSSETKNQLERTIGWLNQWAVSRSYGLGSRLPWDKGVLVESLSDSTIYMAYYTFAHYLHGDPYGRTPGLGNIKADQMTDATWDYLFCLSDKPDDESAISKDTLQTMRREFSYWYPLDYRSSGKDLIQNHLTFFLYIHVAIFPQEYWPRGIRANGHLMLNGEKMSKSTGNFLTLNGAVAKFGADATRVALADAGDGIEDANFEETVADSSIRRLYTLKEWCEEMIHDARLVDSPSDYMRALEKDKPKNADTIQRTGDRVFWDKLFENDLHTLVHETHKHYTETEYKIALKSGLYDLTAARDYYRSSTVSAGIGMHQDLVRKYMSLQALLLAPITPHWADYMWCELLGESSTIQSALWPTVSEPDATLTAVRNYIRAQSAIIGSQEGAQQKRMAKGKSISYDPNTDKRITAFFAKKFPSWQEKYVEMVRDAFDGLSVDMKATTKKMPKQEMKKAMPFVQGLKRKLESKEDSPEAIFGRKLPFSETEILKEMVAGLKATVVKCKEVVLVLVDEGGKTGTIAGGDGKEGEKLETLPPMAENADPGSPVFFFENI